MRTRLLNGIVSGLAITFAGASLQAGPVTWSTGAGGNGNTYNVIVDSTSTWSQAAAAGAGHLVTITSAAEQSFVESLLVSSAARTGSYWIGMKEGSAEGNYGWVTSESFNYTHWDPHEPNNGAGDETVGGILWTSDATNPLASRRGHWNDLPNVGYPNDADGTPVYTDLLRAGYIVETEAGGGGGPKPIPLPAALFATPLAALIAFAGYRRYRVTTV